MLEVEAICKDEASIEQSCMGVSQKMHGQGLLHVSLRIHTEGARMLLGEWNLE
jgi:hypothetical protein